MIRLTLSSLLTKQAPIDPHVVPLNSLVAQEKERTYVNFISRNNFNNNAYRINFGSNNPRSFPSNNYGNNNTYPSTKNSTSELESMLTDFITTQKAFNKSVEDKLEKLDSLSLKVDNIAHDVKMLKIRTSPPEERKTTPMNAIQVQINENIRMLAILKERWAREKEEEERVKNLPTHTTLATLHVVEDLKTFSTHHIASPPNGPINGDANTSTLGQEGPLNLETTKRMSLDDITTTLINGSELDFDNCSLSEVITFCKEWLKTPTL